MKGKLQQLQFLSNFKIMQLHNEALFLKRYQELNEQQKKAVDAIDGTVMVIAGPGTGKTEVLSMRIANLLRSDVLVKPNEILCLTFTDEGAIAMRKRLLSIIGEAAHKVNIHTFHSFCNSIIQSNMEYFGARDLQPATELERMEVIYHVIENIPSSNLLRKLKGNIYNDAKNLLFLFDLMKSENWNAETISTSIDLYLEDIQHRETFLYKRSNASKGIKAGDLKQNDFNKAKDKMERTRAASELFDAYVQRMASLGLYDFSDMILWVVKAFKENQDLLQLQQERFQYLLVDEFQDTSGSQSELLSLIADYWENPNLFVVGDDDQSIFQFQGARLKYIKQFVEQHKATIKIIVLTENYRSTQLVLDRSMITIEHNKQRLVNTLKYLNLNKHITSAHPRFKTEQAVEPSVVIYHNEVHEGLHIIEKIKALQAAGVPLSDVAVLYKNHKQAASLIAQMEREQLPYWVRKPVNILDLPLVQQLLQVFSYLQAEVSKPLSGEVYLFPILHSSFLGIDPIDIATLSLYLQEKNTKHKYWRFLLHDNLLLQTLELNTATAISKLGDQLETWIREVTSLTLPMLFQKIIYDGGVIAWAMQGDSQIWDMQVLHTFFEFIKQECDKKPRITIADFLAIIKKMQDEKIALSIQRSVQNKDGVRFYTAYSAKGHEFEHVFIIGVNKDNWETNKGNNKGFSLPDLLVAEAASNDDIDNPEEVARRVFYVAMTRAKKHLEISYLQQDLSSKALEPSKFIDEISSVEERNLIITPSEKIPKYIATLLSPAPIVLHQLAQKELIEKRLENFVLSVSAMNKYLQCPIAFYFEQILRVPEAKSDSLAFGIAIHYALEQLFKQMNATTDKQYPPIASVISSFEYSMKRNEGSFTSLQYSRRLEMGRTLLEEYYNHYLDTFNKIVLTEYNITTTSINEVPAKGKLDKIEFNGKECIIVDYKTGSPEYSTKKELLGPTDDKPKGGNYWRQMVFYKLLLENFYPSSGWIMTAGVFDFIEKNKEGTYQRFTIPIQEHDLAFVKEQIKEVYSSIMNHEFEQGCNDKKCRWCNFAKTYQLGAPLAIDID
jgi:DNA helicase-2/ATP-dependent DNA helicase PcrA